jgi:hypothetical protein
MNCAWLFAHSPVTFAVWFTQRSLAHGVTRLLANLGWASTLLLARGLGDAGQRAPRCLVTFQDAPPTSRGALRTSYARDDVGLHRLHRIVFFAGHALGRFLQCQVLPFNVVVCKACKIVPFLNLWDFPVEIRRNYQSRH